MLARTTLVSWSQAARTWRAVVSVVREPRKVLPSTAIAVLATGCPVVARPVSQAPIAAVSRSGSRACSSRRIIVSDGRRSGSIPKAIMVAAGTSSTHSAIAV